MTMQSNLTCGRYAAFPSHSLPPNYLPCNGQYVSPSLFPRLFHVIGYSFGQIEQGGETLFRIPPINGRILNNNIVRESSFMRAVLGSGVGEFQNAMLKPHTHSGSTNPSGQHTHDFPTPGSLENRRNTNMRRNENGTISETFVMGGTFVGHTLFHQHPSINTSQTFGANTSRVKPVSSRVVVAICTGNLRE